MVFFRRGVDSPCSLPQEISVRKGVLTASWWNDCICSVRGPLGDSDAFIYTPAHAHTWVSVYACDWARTSSSNSPFRPAGLKPGELCLAPSTLSSNLRGTSWQLNPPLIDRLLFFYELILSDFEIERLRMTARSTRTNFHISVVHPFRWNIIAAASRHIRVLKPLFRHWLGSTAGHMKPVLNHSFIQTR